MTEFKHEDPDRVYKLDEKHRRIIDLTIRKSQPRNEEERELLREIEEIEAKGWMVDIPLIGDE